MKKTVLLVASLIFARTGWTQQTAGTVSLRDAGFIENLGQVKDQFDKPNASVKYIYADHSFNMQLKQAGFSYQLTEIEYKSDMPESGRKMWTETEDKFYYQHPVLHSHRVDVTLEGSNPSAQLLTGDASEAYFNYYLDLKSNAPVMNVHGYKKVMYKDIYPNIDLVFFAPDNENNEPLKYEWMVHPGGDPASIRLAYHGATSITQTKEGELAVMTSKGIISESQLVCYTAENEAPVASSYQLKNNVLRYDISGYDRSKTLVIDPTLVWGTYYGGAGEETIFESEITVDKFGKVYMTGSTESEFNIATAGAFDNDYEKFTDIFLAKFKGVGKLEWGTYFGGKGKDGTFGVSMDPDNNPIICGSTSTDSGMATPGAVKETLTGTTSDILLSKFSSSGSLIWSTYYGGTDREHIRNLAINKAGNIFWGGFTSSKTGIATPAAYDTSYGGGGDCALGEFTKNGGLVWATYWSGKEEDRVHVITLDNDESALFLGGTCESKKDFIINSPGQKKLGGVVDAFLAKWDTTGHYLWAEYIGGNHDDRCRGLVLDPIGNIYITGFTESDDSIASPGAHQLNWSEGYTGDSLRTDDGYLMKFDHNGHYKWGTYYGGTGSELIRGMDIDKKSYLYIAGETQSSENIATPQGFQNTKLFNSNSDGCFSKWDTAGQLIWGSYLGGAGVDEGNDITVDSSGFLYVSLETRGNVQAITTGSNQKVNKGLADVCVFKFSADASCYDQYEPNEIYQSAKVVDAWLPADINIYGLSGNIQTPTDQDWYRIQTKATEPNYKIVLDQLTQPYNISFANKQGVVLFQTIDPTTNPKSLILNGLVQGKYYINIVHNGSQFDPLNCYRLSIYKSAEPFPLKEGENIASGQLEDLALYPNPAADQLSVSISATAANAGNADVMIYNILDQQVYSSRMVLSEGFQQFTLPVSSLSRGTYQVVIQRPDKFWMGRFVKE